MLLLLFIKWWLHFKCYWNVSILVYCFFRCLPHSIFSACYVLVGIYKTLIFWLSLNLSHVNHLNVVSCPVFSRIFIPFRYFHKKLQRTGRIVLELVHVFRGESRECAWFIILALEGNWAVWDKHHPFQKCRYEKQVKANWISEIKKRYQLGVRIFTHWLQWSSTENISSGDLTKRSFSSKDSSLFSAVE